MKGITRSAVSEKLMGCTEGATVTCGGAGDVVQNGPTTSSAYLSAFPNTAVSDNGVGKIDYHINDKNTLNGMLYVGYDISVGEDHPLVSTAFLHPVKIRTWTNSEDWIWTPRSTLVNEIRFGYSPLNFAFWNANTRHRPPESRY